ncbi:hypothetical protein AAFP30_12950 [Gordonia sp. CPCC 205515]|uniref:hypothetical protein n=1 Tax=Gordonia sp. CPCC 205515 TaxID=3140791 RepID=UPI003AF3E7DE
MTKWTNASVAAVAALTVVGGAVIGIGQADAAPRSATFPLLQNGTTVNGWGWTGTLLSKSQTRDAYRLGILGAINPGAVTAYQKAVTPGQGAGCVVVYHATKSGDVENSATYIRTLTYALRTPDTINAPYWSTRNFRCV